MAFPRRPRGGLRPHDAAGDGDDDLDFEPIILSQSRRRTGLWLALFGLVALGGAAAGGWYFIDDFLGESVDTSVPLIRADMAPIKVRPESPGGMQVPDQDKLVYDRMQGQREPPQVEQLLPPPEAPMLPPPPPPPQRLARPEPPVTAEQTPPGPISLVPEQPPPPPKPVETAERLLPEPEKPKPVETSPPPPPQPAPPPPVAAKPAEPPPAKPVESKPAKPPETAPAKPETAVASKPEPKPAPPPPKKAVKPAAAYQIQIAAVRSPTRARGEWKRLQRKHRELLGKLKLSIVKADLGPKKGIYYRLRAGPVADGKAARSLCAALKKRKVGCLVVRPKG